MVFSSAVFLFLFLPVVLAVYAALGSTRLRNAWLLLVSLFFYGWGEPAFLGVMVLSILFNFVMGRLVERARRMGGARWPMTLAVVGNLGMLVVFKYAGFLVESLNGVLAAAGFSPLTEPDIRLPIGISFFTFQAMSYVMDVHRGEVPAQRRPWRVALYISMFPQLVAGPIVRYHDIAREIVSRRVRLADFAAGTRIFTLGLAKKMIVANTLAEVADRIFALSPDALPMATAWLGLLCYTFQIYFDFSGYSDMAIGLGRLFGFHFLENFRYPYSARSVQDFWRRWHMSLSTWFRDYLYIPLGGSRGGRARTARNLVLVFLLCGLWHGASWNFVLWGLFHGVFLVLERTAWGRLLDRLPRPLQHGYALAVAMGGWVLFRSETLSYALGFFASLAGATTGPATLANSAALHLDGRVLTVLVLAAIACQPVYPALLTAVRTLRERTSGTARSLLQAGCGVLELAVLVVLMTASAALLAHGTYNPFIYFRF